MASLTGDPQAQWFSHCANDLKLNDVTFDDFENFLLNLIADSVNRRLNAYERWEEAKQNSNQKITTFKAYLKDLESHLPEFEETHKAFIFLAKLRHELKQKIFGTESVPDTREGILEVAIMQKKNLERQRSGDGGGENSNSNQNRKPKGSEDDKPQNNQNPQQQPSQINQSKQRPSTRATVKRSRESDNVKIPLSEIECHYCHKKGHYASSCPEKQTVGAVVDEVSDSKNGKAPQALRKRSKKDQ